MYATDSARTDEPALAMHHDFLDHAADFRTTAQGIVTADAVSSGAAR